MQDDVTTKIVSALALNLSAGDRQNIAAEHTDNQEAYDCFLRGRELWWRHAKDANREAERAPARAIELDPRFAPAYAFLAAVKVNEYANGWSASPAQRPGGGRQGRDTGGAARRTLPLCAVGARRRLPLGAPPRRGGERGREKVVAFNPSFADGYAMLGFILHSMSAGPEEAVDCFERAMALDPFCSDMILHFQAQALYQLGRYDEAAAILKRRILRNPDTDASRALLAAAYGQMGRLDEAREAWRGLMRVNPRLFARAAPQGAALQEPGRFRAVRRGPAQGGAAGGLNQRRTRSRRRANVGTDRDRQFRIKPIATALMNASAHR